MNTKKSLALSVAAAIGALVQINAHADTQSLGTVTETASSESGFFGAAPNLNVGQTPKSDVQRVQKFDKTATQQETTITKGQFEMISPTDSYTQVLNTLPNAMVVSSGDSMDGDDVYINGFSKSLINFTLDGIPLNDNDSYTYYTNEFIPSVLVAGAKYYPGAASAALPGLAAFGGAFATARAHLDLAEAMAWIWLVILFLLVTDGLLLGPLRRWIRGNRTTDAAVRAAGPTCVGIGYAKSAVRSD